MTVDTGRRIIVKEEVVKVISTGPLESTAVSDLRYFQIAHPEAIDHQLITGHGTNTHAQIDAHIASVNNPHSTTKAQVGLGNVDNTSDANKPVSTATQTALNLKADLASPTLTGVPLTPTASLGTNTQQIASTAYVVAAINALIAAAPGALDTLKELADALGGDPNFATTVTNAIAAKVSKAGDAMTGDLTMNARIRLTSAQPTGADATTDAGLIFNTASTHASGFITEATGRILSMGIDMSQTGAQYTSLSGGIFRFDVRPGQDKFSVITRNTGTAVQVERMTISLLDGTATMQTLTPKTDATYNLGSASLYWANGYMSKVNLNSTTSIDGLTAGRLSMTSGAVFITTTSGDTLNLNATGSANTIIRFADDGVETGAIFTSNGATALQLRAQGTLVLISSNSATARFINFDATNFTPTSNNLLSLGNSSNYWANIYGSRLYTNTTAYIDGASAGQLNFTGVAIFNSGATTVGTHVAGAYATTNSSYGNTTVNINGNTWASAGRYSQLQMSGKNAADLAGVRWTWYADADNGIVGNRKLSLYGYPLKTVDGTPYGFEPFMSWSFPTADGSAAYTKLIDINSSVVVAGANSISWLADPSASVNGSRILYSGGNMVWDFRGGSATNAIYIRTDATAGGTAERLRIAASGWIYVRSNVGAVNPENLSGFAFAWNKSAAEGESIITYNTSTGTDARLAISSFDGTTYTEQASFRAGNLTVKRHTFNTTAYLDGATSGQITGTGFLKMDGGTMSASQYYRAQVAGDVAANVGAVGWDLSMTTSSGNVTGYIRLDRTAATSFLGMSIAQAGRDGIRFMTHATSPVERMRLDVNGNLVPFVTGTYALGSASLYWNGLFSPRLTLNATAYLDGATAGEAHLTGNLFVDTGGKLVVGATTADPDGWARLYVAAGGFRADDDFRFKKGVIAGTPGAQYITRFGGSGYDLVFQAQSDQITLYGAGGMQFHQPVGLLTAAPTHTLTLGSTSTGIAIYNTVDQTTNYERIRQFWNSGEYTTAYEAAGTGTSRTFRWTASATQRTMTFGTNSTGTPVWSISTASTGVTTLASFAGTFSASSGIQSIVAITPTISQNTTGGYTALLVNPTESATGSGAKLLMDLQLASASKFSVDNAGNTIVGNNLSIPTHNASLGNSLAYLNFRTDNGGMIYSSGPYFDVWNSYFRVRTAVLELSNNFTQFTGKSYQNYGSAASVGTTIQNAGPMQFIGRYWNGTSSIDHKIEILPTIVSTGPTSKLAFRWDNVEQVAIAHDGTLTSQYIIPKLNATHDIGSAALYYRAMFAGKLNLNSTASIDGTVAGTVTVTGNLSVSGTITGVPAGASSFSAYPSAGINYGVPGGSVQIISWNTESYDVGNNFASSAYTVPTTGKYTFTAAVGLQSSVGANASIAIYVNGSMYKEVSYPSPLANTTMFITASGQFTAADVITIRVLTSGSLNVYAGPTDSWFEGYRLA